MLLKTLQIEKQKCVLKNGVQYSSWLRKPKFWMLPTFLMLFFKFSLYNTTCKKILKSDCIIPLQGEFLIMKTVLKTVLFCLMLVLFACSSEQQYGAIPASMQQTTVKDIVLNPASDGKEVLIKGKITTQCGSNGCWFFLNDGTGQILVQLSALNLGLPPSTGKTAEVYGIVNIVNQQVAVNARGLKVK
jgi:uncharacterized protein YdeI (BOF family)